MGTNHKSFKNFGAIKRIQKLKMNLIMKKSIIYSTKIITTIICLLFVVSSCSQSKNKPSKDGQTTGIEIQAPKMGLNEAVVSGNLEAVRQHIKANSDLNEKEPYGGSSPLISAAVYGKTEIAKALIKGGADVNLTNKEGSTALHTAAFFCRTKIVQDLIDAGADKTIKNSYGSTALESVVAPFKDVKSIYEMMGQQLSSLGLKLDLERIEKTRPEIAKILH